MTPQYILDFLREREGFRNKVYNDTRGFLTVGLGHKLDRQERNHYGIGTTISDAQLQTWAQADSERAYNAAVAQCAELRVDDSEFLKVLTSVNFQLGTGWSSGFAATWTMLLNHEWEQAAANLSHSLWAKQTPIRTKDFQGAILALEKAGTDETTAPAPIATESSTETQQNAN